MKKIIALFFALVCLLFVKTPFSLTTLSSEFLAEHSFYTTENTNVLNAKTVKNGNGFVVTCQAKHAKNILNNLNNDKIQGESFCFKGQFDDAFKILSSLNAKIVFEEKFDEFSVFYAYSPKLDNIIYIDSKKINIQIAYKNETITVGTPVILGSF